jgi:hypothetical protein
MDESDRGKVGTVLKVLSVRNGKARAVLVGWKSNRILRLPVSRFPRGLARRKKFPRCYSVKADLMAENARRLNIDVIKFIVPRVPKPSFHLKFHAPWFITQ